jgi:Carboxypeptidase regulatory-like domain
MHVALVAASLAPAPSTVFAQTGTIAGTVRTATGAVSNARAVLDSAVEIRTDSSGRFQFRDVAVGRHTLEVLAIGTTPYSVNLIVAARDTLDFEIVLVKTVVLDSVLIEGSTVREGFARAFEDRKRVGLGKYLDSMDVKKFGEVRQALLFVQGVRPSGRDRENRVYFTDNRGGLCLPNVWIDMQNWGLEQGVLGTMSPNDIAAVEVYTRSSLIPDEFRPRGLERGCGALVIWTKRFWPQGKGK